MLAVATGKPQMKKILLILGAVFGVFVLLIVGLVALVFNATSGMPETADRFFAAVRAGNIDAAQAELSEEFRAGTDAAELQRFLAENSLTDVVETSWSDRSYKNDVGRTEGSATTASGGTVPLTIEYVEENDVWKIRSISKSAAGIVAADGEEVAGELEVPTLAERTALVKRSMHDFAVSLNEGNMQHFHGTLSALWRNQSTPEELEQVFGEFYAQELDLLVLDAMQPRPTNKPEIDADGVMTLTGRYATTPSEVTFTHRYIYEGTDWRLIGINVQVGEPEQGDAQ